MGVGEVGRGERGSCLALVLTSHAPLWPSPGDAYPGPSGKTFQWNHMVTLSKYKTVLIYYRTLSKM